MMRSANPTLKASTFEQYRGAEHSTTMTVAGTVNKTFIMLLFLAASASFAWN
ncbi:MAG: Bax inhibitor-1/YccA family protein, partial [Planctomycetota bacterium]|nr:Bax inhibitor-1/YccA family protein [Planctomycetota bacterium]